VIARTKLDRTEHVVIENYVPDSLMAESVA
jgi:hypothetical protein